MDEGYPEAERLYVVLDNVNTRTPAALYRSLTLDLEAGVPLYVQACQLAEQSGDEVLYLEAPMLVPPLAQPVRREVDGQPLGRRWLGVLPQRMRGKNGIATTRRPTGDCQM